MIRDGINPIIFLLNNAQYVIEEQIHPGGYNKLQCWDYTALATAMSAGSKNLFTAEVIIIILQVGKPLAERHRAYTQHVCNRNCGAYKKSAAYNKGCHNPTP